MYEASDLAAGKTIEYTIQDMRNKVKTRAGRILQVTEKHVTVDFGKYKGSFFLDDINPDKPREGAVSIISIRGGEDDMKGQKIDPPSMEELQHIWETSGHNIWHASLACKVSDSTMRKWLIAADIIPAKGLRAGKKEEAQKQTQGSTDDSNQLNNNLGDNTVLSESGDPSSTLLEETDINNFIGGEMNETAALPSEAEKIYQRQIFILSSAQRKVNDVIHDPIAMALMRELMAQGVA